MSESQLNVDQNLESENQDQANPEVSVDENNTSNANQEDTENVNNTNNDESNNANTEDDENKNNVTSDDDAKQNDEVKENEENDDEKSGDEEEKTEEIENQEDEEKPETEEPSPKKSVETLVKRVSFRIPNDCVLTETEELLTAKAFLMKNSEKSNTNVYDHLSQVIMSILDSRIENAIDIFETLSTQTKKKKFIPDSFNSFGEFRYEKEVTSVLEDARNKIQLFNNSNDQRQIEDASESPDLMDVSNLFEWAGLSFGKEETFLINLSMQQLANDKGLKSLRFWGKIYGTKKNYYIVEADQKEGEDEDEVFGDDDSEIQNEEGLEEENAEENNEDETVNENENENENDEENPNSNEENQDEVEFPVPKLKIKKPTQLSKEVKSGVNKYIYYVCNYVGGPWFRLADVIPEKLQISRKIRKYFTGNLSTEIISYPPFNGTEAQYLRCQIARISASTIICPTGYYIFDTEDGEPEDTDGPQPIMMNTEFETISNDQLLDLSNWVHHISYILPQGRTSWENPFGSDDDDENDEEGSDEEGSDEEEANGEKAEPETGPQLLTPISQDDEIDDIPSWVSKFCSRTLAPAFNPVCISSTRWPGAHTVALSDKFSSIYIGDGMKCNGNSDLSAYHIPQPLTSIMKEYQESEVEKEITEQIDPTVEEEKVFEEEQAEKLREKEEEEEGDEEEEEEESEEES